MFLALARGRSNPIEQEVKRLPLQPENGQWLNFLRHHDDLALDKLNDEERNEVFRAFAPSENMRIFGTGIRRRLAPMLNNNRKQMEMVHSMIFSFPGIPMIRYGDEIGMGEDLSLYGRMSVRTVMQWSGEKNGGFSKAESNDLILPVIADGPFGYTEVNVAKQYSDEKSFLNFIRKLVRLRKQISEIGEGVFSVVGCNDPALLIHKIDGKENSFLAIHNLSGKKVKTDCNLNADEAMIILSDDNDSDLYQVAPYGYRWLLIKK
jgi:maltose alpha-D-glucosyltransferase/alpha-amylase